ncbi:MAG: S8 family serine peptidase [Sedimentisphaerales bacterium]|nr:S8 family serine peptidase [Sedimentisphaerales bacterium]
MGCGAKKIFGLYLLLCIAAGGAFASISETLQPQGLNVSGIYALRQFDPNLTGAGVKFAVICRSNTYIDGVPQNDYRAAVEHSCFKDKQLNFNNSIEPAAGISPHSTAVCSILLGEDPNASNPQLGRFRYQGAAPKAQADNYEFWYFLTNNVFSNSPPDADVVTASFGTQFEDWWTRGIEAMAEQHGLIVVTGIGNGSNAYDPPLYPGAASNVIGVGVVNSVNTENLAAALSNFSLAFPEHSSLGPTADGRCKPDIVAPGNCLAADANNPNNYEPTGNWSSFSTPIVAGTIGLLVQKAKEDSDLSAAVAKDGGNCVIKAILLNSAKKLPFWHKGKLEKDDDHEMPLDFLQGAGMVSAVGAYKHLIAGQAKPGNVPTIGWDNNLLKSENLQNIYKITLANPAENFITATINWNRHFSGVYPFEALSDKDANLRLELWAVDPNNPGRDYLLDYSDSRADNLEHIYVKADANFTNYELIITFSDINGPNLNDTDQRYGLAWDVTKKQNKSDMLWYDLNADGVVNESDFNVLLDSLLADIQSSGAYLLGDIDGSGTIDSDDLRILTNRKNLSAGWLTETKPE